MVTKSLWTRIDINGCIRRYSIVYRRNYETHCLYYSGYFGASLNIRMYEDGAGSNTDNNADAGSNTGNNADARTDTHSDT